MGAKGSTQSKVPAQKEIHISKYQIIDPTDATIFPKAVRDELMAVRQEIPPSELVLVKEFGRGSELVKWLRQCKSYFDFNVNEEDEYEPLTEEEQGMNALTMRLRRLHRGGAGVNRDKTPFLAELEQLCNSPHIQTKFLATVLETANRFLLAFLNTGDIAGFMIFDEEGQRGRKCLHRYITCTGPRGLGIGIALVKEIHAIAKREGYTCVTLGASGSEGFHAKQGYVRTGKETLEGPEMIYQIPTKGGKRQKPRQTRKQKQPQNHHK